VAAAGAATVNTLLSCVSPISRVEVKTASGQTIMNYSRAQAFARTISDRLKNSDNSFSSTTNARFIQTYNAATINAVTKVDVYDYYNGAVNSTTTVDAGGGAIGQYNNALISTNSQIGFFSYSVLLSDVIGGIF
jgi:hypothetical protein